jgi:methionyl-tRNA synthetase
MFIPFLPFSSEKLHSFFGYEAPLFGEQYIEDVTDALGSQKVLRYRDVSQIGRDSIPEGYNLTYWTPSELKSGAKLDQPGLLFKKLEESVIEEERARLGK